MGEKENPAGEDNVRSHTEAPSEGASADSAESGEVTDSDREHSQNAAEGDDTGTE